MTGKIKKTLPDPEPPPGLYDGTAAEQDLWFLPGEIPDDLIHTPLPRADHRLIDVAEWAAAQAALPGELAQVALLYGALEERLRLGPRGWRHRLALREATDLSWAVGDRIPVDRLGLWQVLHLSGVQDDAPGLARASWAFRRLVGDAVPEHGLASFLGRQGRPEAVADLSLIMADLAQLHAVTRAVALAQGWRMLGQGGAACEIEALVLAGSIAAAMGRGVAGFVPQGGGQAARGGAQAPRSAAKDWLASWLKAAAQAVLAALLHLDRVRDWQASAGAALADLQGRTPALLLAVLTGWPLVTAPMAEALTGASTATVRRNLAVMQDRRLVREVTGQGRYRVWTAQL